MKKKILVILVLIYTGLLPAYSQNIKINEICASNYISYEDSDDDHGDWIELYNAGSSSVNVAGMYLTDDYSNLTKYKIPSTSSSTTTISSHGYLIFWLDEDTYKGITHVPFKLDGDGEQLALVASNGTTILDSITFGKQHYDVTYGRTTNGSSSWSYFPTPTPKASNTGGGYVGITGKAKYNLLAGFYNSTIHVELSYPPDPTASIYYSLNGNEPSPTRGILYTGPIQVDTNAAIRARVYKSNYVPGDITTQSYFVNRNHNLPILSVVTDSSNLWDINTGIYCFGVDDYDHSYPYSGANFHEDWKRPGHVELFEADDSKAISQNVNISISGNTSRGYPQKSINFESNNALGKGNIPYPLFPQLPMTEYQAFKIRNGGSDWSSTHLRDAVNHSLGENAMDMEYMANRPVIVYINGEYWGMMMMTEKIDEDFLNGRYPTIDKDSVDILYNNAKIVNGTNTGYNSLIDFITNNSLSVQSNYNYIKSHIDVLNYTNYTQSRIYFATTDWPSNNIKFWRPHDLSMKWRWIQWDTDRSDALTQDPSRRCNYDQNTLEWATTNSIVPAWARFLLNNMLLSAEFKNNFITQYAHNMNFTYCPIRVDSVLNSYRSRMSMEMPKHIARWEHTNDTLDYYTAGFYHSLAEWNIEVDTIKLFFAKRAKYMRGFIMQQFGVSDTSELLISKVPVNGGIVSIDTFPVPDNPCRLIYFDGHPVTLTARPNPGFEFVGWTTSTGDTLPLSWNPNGDTTVTAYFTNSVLANQPSTAASNISSSTSNCLQINLNWTNGDGSSRIVIARSGAAVNKTPLDGSGYNASSTFGNGTHLGNSNYVVYSGNGNSCSISGLAAGVQYHFAIFEFNGSGSGSNYLTSSYLTGSASSPVFTITATATFNSFCTGNSTVITANGGGSVFQWTPGTGLSSTSQATVTATPTVTTTYTVTATNASGCQSTSSIAIVVHPIPSVTQTNYQDVCISASPVSLNGGAPAGGVYSGSGVSGGMFNPAAAGTGLKTITYNYTSPAGCSSSATATIRVRSNPTVTLSTIPDVCLLDAPVVLTGGSPSGGNYIGTGVTNGFFDPGVTGAGTNTISYEYTDSYGCSSTDVKSITVHPNPAVSLSGFSDVCVSTNPVILSGGNPAGGLYSGAGVSNGTFNPSVSGSYSISYSFTDANNCSSTTSSNLTVNPGPSPALINDTVICAGSSIVLDPGSGYDSYLWNTGANTQTIVADTSGWGAGTSTYAVTVTNSFNCAASDSVAILFDLCSGISLTKTPGRFSVFPNPFGNSLTLVSDEVGCTVTLFDVLGKIIYSTEIDKETLTIYPSAPAGIYFLRIENEQVFNNHKLVKY